MTVGDKVYFRRKSRRKNDSPDHFLIPASYSCSLPLLRPLLNGGLE